VHYTRAHIINGDITVNVFLLFSLEFIIFAEKFPRLLRVLSKLSLCIVGRHLIKTTHTSKFTENKPNKRQQLIMIKKQANHQAN